MHFDYTLKLIVCQLIILQEYHPLPKLILEYRQVGNDIFIFLDCLSMYNNDLIACLCRCLS